MGLAASEWILIFLILGLPIAVVGLVVYLGINYSKKQTAKHTKLCSHCAERIQAAAVICRFCQRDV